MIKAVAGLAVVACLAAGCTRGRHVAKVPTTTEPPTTSIHLDGPDLGPAVDLVTLRDLPSEGVAVQYDYQTVVFLTIDGHVLGHVAGDLRPGGPPGPIDIEIGTTKYRLDPRAGRFRIVPKRGYRTSFPLAYGAEIVSESGGDPAPSWVERGGHRLLELGNGMASSSVVSNDRDVVSVTRDSDDDGRPVTVTHAAIDLRTGATRHLPEGCDVGDRHGDRWYLVRIGPASSMRVLNTRDGKVSQLTGPVNPKEAWNRVAVSPDGQQLLMQWSYDCRGQLVQRASSAGVLAETWRGAALVGWTLDGHGVLAVSVDTACPNDAADPGVYVVDPSGNGRLIFRLEHDTIPWGVQLWQPLPR